MCDKRVYRDEEHASHVAYLMWCKYPDVDIEDLRPYRCPTCGQWNIGSLAKFEAKRNDLQPRPLDYPGRY